MDVDPEVNCTLCGKKLIGDEYGWCDACDKAQESRYWKSFT